MTFSAGPWELAIVLSKVLGYVGLASLAGGILVLWLGSLARSNVPTQSPPDRFVPSQESRLSKPDPGWSPSVHCQLLKLLLLASVLGAVAVVLFFLLQIGVINQMGIAGMFDRTMFDLLAQTNVGFGVGLKLAGFAMAGGAVWWFRAELLTPARRLPGLFVTAWLLALILFGVSFAILGHIAELSLPARIVITVHVAVAGLWIGALYPLHVLCESHLHERSREQLVSLLRLFGKVGWGVVAALLLSGVFLVLQVIGAVNELFTTDYGLTLLMKLVLVVCLLCLAALNKFRLVPAMDRGSSDRGEYSLRRSIKAEMVLALLILIVTAFLTTVTGPQHLMQVAL